MSLPVGACFNGPAPACNPRQFLWTPSFSQAGSYTFRFTVGDGTAASEPVERHLYLTVTQAPPLEVFADSFEVSEWNGLWSEDSQNDWYRSSQRGNPGSYSAEVDGSASNAKLISMPINLQGRPDATVSFSWYIESSLDTGEYLAFDVSTDGGTTWQEKARLRGNVDPENTWRAVTVTLTNLTTLRLRFRGSMSGSDEDANVDNVRVMAW
jgi:hypothetical protein